MMIVYTSLLEAVQEGAVGLYPALHGYNGKVYRNNKWVPVKVILEA